MTPAEVVALAGFVGVVFAGAFIFTLLDLLHGSVSSRLRRRVIELDDADAADGEPAAAEQQAELFRLRERAGVVRGWLEARVARLGMVAGPHASYAVAVAAGMLAVLGCVASSFAALSPLASLAVGAAAGACGAAIVERFVVRRFRERFLAAFPDAIDLIVRAARAGIPVSQSIASVGTECEAPLRAEFARMADGLRLGLDLKEVLEAASNRLRIADFSFFTVCLTLQRDSGGQLTETLENLAQIIRARREVAMKSRAMTAESRLTSKIIAAIPFFITGMLYWMNPDYIGVLFTTQTGRKILIAALVSLTSGLLLIQKMARLGTTR